MTARPVQTPSAPSRTAYAGAYAVLVVLAAVAFALWLWHARQPGPRARSDAFGWLLPVGLMTLGVGGLLGARWPRVHRLAVGVALVMAVAALWTAFAR